MDDYNVIDSLGLREVKNLPPHFFTINIPAKDLPLIKTGRIESAWARLSYNRSEVTRFRDFIEEKMSGRYYVAMMYNSNPRLSASDVLNTEEGQFLLIGFEDESDLTLFNLLITYKSRT